jgi:phage-related holin
MIEQKIGTALSLGNYTLIVPASVTIGPFLSFFGVPIFGVLMLILFVDFLTGLWKAKVSKKMQSNKFGSLLNRAAIYILLFTLIHALVGTVPNHVGSVTDLLKAAFGYTEYALFFGYCLKELLSVFENLKAIQVATGSKEIAVVEMAIKYFGIDLEKALKDIADSQFRQAAKAQSIHISPDEANPENVASENTNGVKQDG